MMFQPGGSPLGRSGCQMCLAPAAVAQHGSSRDKSRQKTGTMGGVRVAGEMTVATYASCRRGSSDFTWISRCRTESRIVAPRAARYSPPPFARDRSVAVERAASAAVSLVLAAGLGGRGDWAVGAVGHGSLSRTQPQRTRYARATVRPARVRPSADVRDPLSVVRHDHLVVSSDAGTRRSFAQVQYGRNAAGHLCLDRRAMVAGVGRAGEMAGAAAPSVRRCGDRRGRLGGYAHRLGSPAQYVRQRTAGLFRRTGMSRLLTTRR